MFFVRVKHTPPLNKPPKCANPPKKCSTHIDHIYAKVWVGGKRKFRRTDSPLTQYSKAEYP